jgi:hypothetical protein
MLHPYPLLLLVVLLAPCLLIQAITIRQDLKTDAISPRTAPAPPGLPIPPAPKPSSPPPVTTANPCPGSKLVLVALPNTQCTYISSPCCIALLTRAPKMARMCPRPRRANLQPLLGFPRNLIHVTSSTGTFSDAPAITPYQRSRSEAHGKDSCPD